MSTGYRQASQPFKCDVVEPFCTAVSSSTALNESSGREHLYEVVTIADSPCDPAEHLKRGKEEVGMLRHTGLGERASSLCIQAREGAT